MTTLPTTPTRELLDRDAVLNIIPTNWCDSLLTGPKAVLPQGNTYGYSPKHIEKLLLAIKAQIEALPHSTLTAENARLAERVRVLEGALEPFAKAAEYYDETNGNNGPELESLRLLHGVTVGDLRLARSLTQKDGE